MILDNVGLFWAILKFIYFYLFVFFSLSLIVCHICLVYVFDPMLQYALKLEMVVQA